jgi:exosortase/archaeosortase family protein
LYILVFIIGLLGVYLVNVLRLLLLIIAGVHISPRFAIGLVHTNAGWVFFIAYFLCYYLIVRKFIYKNKLPVKK